MQIPWPAKRKSVWEAKQDRELRESRRSFFIPSSFFTAYLRNDLSR